MKNLNLYLVREGETEYLGTLELLKKEDVPEVNWTDEALVLALNEHEAKAAANLYDTGLLNYGNYPAPGFTLVALWLTEKERSRAYRFIVREVKRQPAQIRHATDYATRYQTRRYEGQHAALGYLPAWDENPEMMTKAEAIKCLKEVFEAWEQANPQKGIALQETSAQELEWEGPGYYSENGLCLYALNSESATDGDCLHWSVEEVKAEPHKYEKGKYQLASV